MSVDGEAARYRRLEREWQDDHGQDLLEKPWKAPGSAAVMERQFAQIIENLDLKREGTIVEVGCGKGHLLRRISDVAGEAGPTLIGVDISNAITALPQKGLLGIQGDGEQLPFRDASVRTVIYDGSLHHLIDYRSALREADRVLEPGGSLVMLEPVSSRFTRLVHRLVDPLIFKKVVYESPIDLRYKGFFHESTVVDELRHLRMRILSRRTDFLAYPLTGCYAGSAFSRFTTLVKIMIVVERAIMAVPVLNRLAMIFCWRFMIVATKRLAPVSSGRN